MASLDVLDFQLAVDAALAEPGPSGAPLLPAALRSQAVREARHVVDAMAFRFALLDERALPEDSDYVRALDALKSPARVAEVLARRSPLYAAKRRRRLVTTWSVLGVIALVVVGFAFLITIEEADTLASLTGSATEDLGTITLQRNFTVAPEVDRLHLDGNIIVRTGSSGVIEVRLIAPDGSIAFVEGYGDRSGNYLRANLLNPPPGQWTLIIDFLAVNGAATVSVDGVRPTR